MEASDFHCENLIAASEHPILIDLEALFHPFGKVVSNRAGEIAGSTMFYSAFGVGLLPARFWADGDQPGIDLSGLGSSAGQLSPRAVPRWEHVGTDEMRVIRKRVPMSGSANRPSLNEQEVNALDYAEAIASGFASTYRLLMAHRTALMTVIDRFSQDQVRVIARALTTAATPPRYAPPGSQPTMSIDEQVECEHLREIPAKAAVLNCRPDAPDHLPESSYKRPARPG